MGPSTATSPSLTSTSNITIPENAVVSKKNSENRRSNKPIMEKRRRARINQCLAELKSLVLDAMKKDPARHSKLEKADILEMAVRHLETLHRQQAAMSAAADPSVVNKYRAGFSECANEVSRYLTRIGDMDSAVRQRLMGHLTSCVTAETDTSTTRVTVPTQTRTSVGTTTIYSGLHLVPTRLVNGDIAFIVPASTRDISVTKASLSNTVFENQITVPSVNTIEQRLAQVTRTSSAVSPVLSLETTHNKVQDRKETSVGLDLRMTSTCSPENSCDSVRSGNSDSVVCGDVKSEESMENRFKQYRVKIDVSQKPTVRVSPNIRTCTVHQHTVDMADLKADAENVDDVWRPW